MKFDHVTERYLYPDRYSKIIPDFLNTFILVMFRNEDDVVSRLIRWTQYKLRNSFTTSGFLKNK
jgi:hypothetical protein